MEKYILHYKCTYPISIEVKDLEKKKYPRVWFIRNSIYL